MYAVRGEGVGRGRTAAGNIRLRYRRVIPTSVTKGHRDLRKQVRCRARDHCAAAVTTLIYFYMSSVHKVPRDTCREFWKLSQPARTFYSGSTCRFPDDRVGTHVCSTGEDKTCTYSTPSSTRTRDPERGPVLNLRFFFGFLGFNEITGLRETRTNFGNLIYLLSFGWLTRKVIFYFRFIMWFYLSFKLLQFPIHWHEF